MDCPKWSSFALSSHLCWPFWLPHQCIPSQLLPLSLSRWAPLSPLKLFLATPCSLSSPKAWQPKIILFAAPPTTLQDPKSYKHKKMNTIAWYLPDHWIFFLREKAHSETEWISDIPFSSHEVKSICVHTRAETGESGFIFSYASKPNLSVQPLLIINKGMSWLSRYKFTL